MEYGVKYGGGCRCHACAADEREYVVRSTAIPSSKWIAGESGLTNRSNFGHDAGQNMGLRICTTDSERERKEKSASVIISSSSDDDDKDLSDGRRRDKG